MVLVRERRNQQPLRLPLPLQEPSLDFHQWNTYPLPMVSTGPDSPTIESLFDLEKLGVVGHGNGGIVYKVQHLRNSSVYALKVLRFENENFHLRKKAVGEAEILKQVDSEFIVRCHGVFDSGGDTENGDLCFLMEYMEGGSLNDVLRVHGSLPENVISGVAKRVLEGLSYLHGLHIVHRDIKPSNLLINGQGEVKIADFGVSRVLAGTFDASEFCEGTCAYMSPERFDSDKWTESWCNGFAGDVWALGLALLECYMGHFPLLAPGKKPDWVTLMCAICFIERPEIPSTASSEFKSFIYRCLEKDWRRRGTVTELLRHPFVAKQNTGLVDSF
ncbi:hypothetical protein AQUCO_00500535v1 [Aquilegia coerulea]|uniref:mitogen-activated protein kinase kinase n=1 Tax=Aquilegia coerulea TaxID=218851 RepID=A0A2G5ESK3_AQUCA|nr:hypothetical protein AQUCO_00500535v1 [Aquilegia coerulea]